MDKVDYEQIVIDYNKLLNGPFIFVSGLQTGDSLILKAINNLGVMLNYVKEQKHKNENNVKRVLKLVTYCKTLKKERDEAIEFLRRNQNGKGDCS